VDNIDVTQKLYGGARMNGMKYLNLFFGLYLLGFGIAGIWGFRNTPIKELGLGHFLGGMIAFVFCCMSIFPFIEFFKKDSKKTRYENED